MLTDIDGEVLKAGDCIRLLVSTWPYRRIEILTETLIHLVDMPQLDYPVSGHPLSVHRDGIVKLYCTSCPNVFESPAHGVAKDAS